MFEICVRILSNLFLNFSALRFLGEDSTVDISEDNDVEKTEDEEFFRLFFEREKHNFFGVFVKVFLIVESMND